MIEIIFRFFETLAEMSANRLNNGNKICQIPSVFWEHTLNMIRARDRKRERDGKNRSPGPHDFDFGIYKSRDMRKSIPDDGESLGFSQLNFHKILLFICLWVNDAN